jgi:3-keto-5-aminohexanoate cleavage enzyme
VIISRLLEKQVAVSWDELPVVVTVAPTGAEVTRADNPALPHTPAEIVADVAACAEAGASVCHLHVREDDGSPSSRPALFEEAVALIGDRTPIVTMVSTGGAVWMSIEERITGLEARSDLAGVETGSMNFGEDLFVTSPTDGRRVIQRATKLGIGLEAEMFDVGHVVQAVRMLERGVLASSNAELVADARTLVEMLGRRPATIDEARELLACPVR